ncbi:hypothetical protein LZ32DRAFT_673453, partial [Colletotrichum eremochloae]
QPEARTHTEDQARRDQVKQIIKEADDRFAQRDQDSKDRLWCKPVSRDTVVEKTQAFHNSMHDDHTLDTGYCRVCYLQRPPSQLQSYSWVEFEPLYNLIADQVLPFDREHFQCCQCFPREAAGTFDVCLACKKYLREGNIPYHCRVNNLSLGCTHRYPKALSDLTPLEERLIGIYTPCGWITKLTIEVEKWTSGKYRKHKRGHITIFPNDVQGTASNVLPHPLLDELDRLHVCFVGPRKPVPSDLSFMLSVRPARLRRALVWLCANNPLYSGITIDEHNLQTWSEWCPGTEVPRAVVDQMVEYELNAEDAIRSGNYVPPAERGRPDEPVRTAAEVLTSLEDREHNGAAAEAESNARLGGLHASGRDLDDMDPRHIEEELEELKSTGLMAVAGAGEYSPQERLRMLRNATFEGRSGQRGRKPNNYGTQSTRVAYNDETEPYIVNQRGEDLVDTNDPDFFPKTFPCLFPWGRGGPRGHDARDTETADQGDGQNCNKPKGFTLREWARVMLQRHGGHLILSHFATHPSFAFLVFNMLVRSQNRRISYGRMTKASWQKVEDIITTLTSEEVMAAEEEYRSTRTTTNPRMSFLAQELSAFGQHQHMSNEERLYSRRKIKSLCIKHGMPSIWYTINPNDLTNGVNMKLAAFRVADGVIAEELLDKFRRQIGRIQHVVRDAVSSAKFFHREIELFFKHLVCVGEDSIFGKVSCYFGCIETNERGALHIHGLLWLDENIRLPYLFQDLSEPDQAGYGEQVCVYIDSVYSECCDVPRARRYRRWDSVFTNIKHLTADSYKLSESFDDEANWVAYRCQMHSCGATCTKYSFKDEAKSRGQCHLCRFKAPWPLRERTEFADGLLRIRRDHERINRYSPALAVAMRHNTDTVFLPTNSAGLSMVCYATNYSTKLETPLFKRMALVNTVLDWATTQKGGVDVEPEDETQKTAQKNNKARQFLARVANQVFTSRELSAVEVCSSLLGYQNSYCSENQWVNVHLNSVYWAVFRRWDGLQQAAGPDVQARVVPETVGFGNRGFKLSALDAYVHRGLLLRDLCFYEYLSMVRVQGVGHKGKARDASYIPFESTLQDHEWWIQKVLKGADQAVPVFSGYIDNDVEGSLDGFYKRQEKTPHYSTLFVSWEQFIYTPSRSPRELWETLKHGLPKRVLALVDNVQLLHKSAEDAKKDAQLWASRSEGDEGIEFDGAEEAPELGGSWTPGEDELRHTFHNVVASLHDDAGVTRGSPGLGALLGTLDKTDFSAGPNSRETTDHKPVAQAHRTITKRTLKAVKAAQDRLHRERMLAIEGDEAEDETTDTGAETGFGDGGDEEEWMPVTTPRSEEGPAPAQTWVDVTPGATFTHAATAVSTARTLNQMQHVALMMACEALDSHSDGEEQQHLQYIGGGGGTGKSWLIDSIKQVFASKAASSQLVITAMSGTAAAGIGGTTIHSAVGLAFRDAEGTTVDPIAAGNTEKAKERWRRRSALVVDEASMLGLLTLYEVDQKLRMLQGFPEKPFGGLPVVIFAGDFLQFTPVLQKSLLADIERTAGPNGAGPPGGRAAERRWKEAEAKRLWDGFRSVVILKEQKRAQGDANLLGFLERLRNGKQTRQDADQLAARYKPDAKLDFAQGRRAIIPLNRHRWDLTIHAAMAYATESGQRVSFYLAEHKWESRVPTSAERMAAMLLGDENGVAAAGVFPYVKRMPLVVNENRYMG